MCFRAKMSLNYLQILGEYSALSLKTDTPDRENLSEEKVRLFEKFLEKDFEENVSAKQKLSLYLCDILRKITEECKSVRVPFTKQENDWIYLGLVEIVLNGLAENLPETVSPRNMLNKGNSSTKSHVSTQIPLNFIKECISVIEDVLRLQNFVTDQSLEVVYLHQIAALVYLKATSEELLPEVNLIGSPEGILKQEKLIKYLLLLKSFPQLPKEISLILHSELMKQIRLPGGFRSLAANIVLSGDANSPQWKKCDTLAKIISSPGHGSSFYLTMVEEIASTVREALEKEEDQLVEASIVCLSALHEVKVKGVKTRVENVFVGALRKLANPEENLTGVILLDNKSVMSILRLNSRAFRGSVSGAKSKILVGILPLIFELHAKFPDNSQPQEILQDLFVKCLSNRSDEELEKLTEIFLFGENYPNLLRLHPRIVIRESKKDEFSVQMGPEEDSQCDSAGNFVKILKRSNHNLLTYNIFKKILKLFGDVKQEKEKRLKLELLEAEDAQQIIEETFKRKTILILTLSELISFQQIHFLLRENPQDIVPFILEALRKEADKDSKEEVDSETVIILMSIFREFVVSDQAECFRKDLWQLLKKIRMRTSSDLGEYIDIFSREISEDPTSFTVKSKFQEVRLLCDEKMPHIRVYGMTEMIKLIEQKDVETLANLHSTFHIALQYLTDEDSYSFLTCIRLLVLLTLHLDEGAVDTLIHEYENADKEIDFRLKVGEAIVKITEDLGAVAFKFRGILINCFLRGARNAHEDFRTSALYNLGGICRILTFQVHHFFNEMLTTITGILQTDTYAPCRRAATLILTQVLQGIENLVDFQEFLLPIYRLLRHIRETETDDQCRIHAENGLKVINSKVKESLNPEEQLVREIKIFGVKDDGKPKASILEL